MWSVRFNEATPSPAAFNHLITRAVVDRAPVWLDATEEVGRWGALINVIRDHEALVIPAAGPAAVAHTPADLPYPQRTTVEVKGVLDTELTSDSTMTLTLHSDDELYMRAALRNVSPANYGAFVQQMMANLGFGGTTSDAEIQNLEDPSQALAISFHYHRVKEKDWGENRITMAFAPTGMPYFAADKPPVAAIQLGAKRTETSRVEMKLPEGWTVERPEVVHAKAPFATCDVTYSASKGSLVAERTLTILESKVAVKDFKQYEEWYETAGASGVPYVQLNPPPKAVSAATVAEPKTPKAGIAVGASNAEAAKLVEAGLASLRARELDEARKSYDQAARLNETQPGLWAGYALIAQALGKQNEMIEDLLRELSYHPDEVQYYAPLSVGQLSSGDREASLATLRSWVKAAPDSLPAWVALTYRLQMMKQPADELAAARAGIANLEGSHDDPIDLRVAEGNALIDLGKPKQAAEAVQPFLATATDAVKVNNLAWVLAEAGQSLPEASAAMGKALTTREVQTTSWTLADEFRPIEETQAEMAAEWDTMAWILYRQGKFAEAMGYETAARHMLDSDDKRDHAAAIAAAMHDPPAAGSTHKGDLEWSKFALGKETGKDGVGVVKLLLADGKVLDSVPGDASSSAATPLTDAAEYLKRADLRVLFPPGSVAHLVREGFVDCHGGACDLVLSPLR